MIPKKIINYLEKNKISYEIIPHKTVYTVFDKAQTLKKKISEIAKTLLIKADKNFILTVLPAHLKVDLKKLKKNLKVKKIAISKENVIKKILKLKPGTQTPFASLHHLRVLIDKKIFKNPKIIVGGGSYTESLRVKSRDLLKLGGEMVSSFSFKKKKKKR